MFSPILEYRWESHLDKSMPNGCTVHLPAPWLYEGLNLSLRSGSRVTYITKEVHPCFTSGYHPDRGTGVFVEYGSIQNFLDQQKLCCVWIYLNERNSWPNGNNELSTWRRIEGIAILNKDGSISKTFWENNRGTPRTDTDQTSPVPEEVI
jgi:hypothetical protein